jgi:hypothetical protein
VGSGRFQGLSWFVMSTQGGCSSSVQRKRIFSPHGDKRRREDMVRVNHYGSSVETVRVLFSFFNTGSESESINVTDFSKRTILHNSQKMWLCNGATPGPKSPCTRARDTRVATSFFQARRNASLGMAFGGGSCCCFEGRDFHGRC